jgi:hypothetical protein
MHPKTRDILCAVLSGLLLSASFPPAGIPWLAWIALVPLLWSISDKSASRALGLGLLTGFAHSLTLMYWILVVMGHYGGLDIVTSTGILVLFSLYLALFPACFAGLARRFPGGPFQVLWWGVLWASQEYVRARILTGFPWCLLGHSQYPLTSLIQMADLTGVYGLSFLIALSNGVIYRTLFDRAAFRRPGGVAEATLVILLVAASLVYGRHRVESYRLGRGVWTSLRAAVVQGNTDAFFCRRPGETPAGKDDERFAAQLAWMRDRLGPDRVAYLAHLPFAHQVTPAAGHELLVVHANPTDLTRPIVPQLADADLDAALLPAEGGEPGWRALAFGHIHVPHVRQWRGRLLVDVASAGLPMDGDQRAVYAVLTWDGRAWRAEHHRVYYPVPVAAHEMRTSGMPRGKHFAERLVAASYGKSLQLLAMITE